MKLSIITPSYNQAAFIERSILSILEQSVTVPVEYIVMDGGSTDGTLDILKKFEGRLKWISERDAGQSDALNKGIAMASGDIIGWLNSDDVYLPGTLQKVTDGFESNPGAQWLYGMCRMIDENDREIRSWITRFKKYRSLKFSYTRLLTENFISQPAVFFRRDAFLSAGRLFPDQHYAMDYDLWLRFGKNYPPVVVKDYLSAFRLHGSSKSTTNFRKLFTEQYEIHYKYDRRKLILLRHRVTINTILVAYRILGKIARIR